MLRALITRPRQDAIPLARELERRGIEPVIEPVIEIVPRTGATLDFTGVQALLATSANGIRALAGNSPRRDLPVFAVGETTARVAIELGFKTVESADGDVASLAALVNLRLNPRHGAVLHVAGRDRAGDLGAMLSAQGFEARREVLYEAQTVSALSPALLDLLDRGGLNLALFFSPRTADAFVTLIRACNRSESCRVIAAYGLSDAVTKVLAVLSWQRLRAAPHPRQAALLELLDRDLSL